MHVLIHVKHPSFLSDFSVTWILSKGFRKNSHISKFMKTLPVWTESYPADGKTDRQIGVQAGMTKVRVAFRNFVNTPKTVKSLNRIFLYMYGDTLWREAPDLVEAGLFDNSYWNRPLWCNVHFAHRTLTCFYIPQNKRRLFIYTAFTGFCNREAVFTARNELNILFAFSL
jgi:hypothetical protein